MASNRVPPAGATSATTSSAGIVQLTDSTSSTSTTTAATPNAVKSAYDLANGAIQKTLTTTTGDIIYASSANTPARLGIGSSGQYLTVSSGVPAWSTLSTTTRGFFVQPLPQYITISNNTTLTIPFDATDYIDTDNFHDPASNNTRVTIPAGLGGKYLVSYGIQYNGQTSGYSEFSLNRNNGLVCMARTSGWANQGNIQIGQTQLVDLSAGDYLELKAWQNSGGNTSFWGVNNSGGRSTWMSGFRVGD